MAIQKLLGGDKISEAFAKLNGNVDKMFTGASFNAGVLRLTLYDGTNIDVNISGGTVTVDGVTIENSPSGLRVKNLGITTAKLADGSVSTMKLQDLSVTNDKIATNTIGINKLDYTNVPQTYGYGFLLTINKNNEFELYTVDEFGLPSVLVSDGFGNLYWDTISNIAGVQWYNGDVPGESGGIVQTVDDGTITYTAPSGDYKIPYQTGGSVLWSDVVPQFFDSQNTPTANTLYISNNDASAFSTIEPPNNDGAYQLEMTKSGGFVTDYRWGSRAELINNDTVAQLYEGGGNYFLTLGQSYNNFNLGSQNQYAKYVTLVPYDSQFINQVLTLGGSIYLKNQIIIQSAIINKAGSARTVTVREKFNSTTSVNNLNDNDVLEVEEIFTMYNSGTLWTYVINVNGTRFVNRNVASITNLSIYMSDFAINLLGDVYLTSKILVR